MELARILFNAALVASIISLQANAGGLSGLTCNKSQNSGFHSIYQDGRIHRKDLEQNEAILENAEKLGGLVEFGEKPISPEDKKGILELMRMYSASSKIEIKFEDSKSEKIKNILLGLPLTGQYSINLRYERTERSLPSESGGVRTNTKYLRLIEGILVDPAGIEHKVFGRSILQPTSDLMGATLNRELQANLQDFPGLEKFNFKIFLPIEISGSVLDKFSKIANRLIYVDKEKVGAMAEKNQYYRLRWELFKSYVQTNTAHYIFKKGGFKTIAKKFFWTLGFITVIGSPLLLRQTNPEAVDNGVKWVQQELQFQKDNWVSYTIKQFSYKDGLPAAVKSQLGNLAAEFETKLKNQDVFCANSCKFPLNLNTNAKYEFANNKYIWTEVKVDPETKKTLTLFYVAKVVDSTGSVAVATIPVDPKQYSQLIDYLENRGKFFVPPLASTP